MGKIHTHYDNLKVSRMAPQEVIRAAYKALSQKYHPDKNPGDEKAARIMAILNSAYGTLSDTQRRKEHDEWIAAEEWEIEWLESTRHEDGREHRDGRQRHDGPPHAWGGDAAEPTQVVSRRPRRDWLWWGGMGVCLLAGWVGGTLMVAQPQLIPAALVSAWSGKAELAPSARAAARAESSIEARSADSGVDGWAVSKPSAADASVPARPAPIKVLSMSQILLPDAPPDCESEPQAPLVAPNGEAWPQQSGYVEGFAVANHGADMQLTLDNAKNASPVFIKVYDLERHANVRYVYVRAHDKLLVDQLALGKYEIRYQNIDPGADQSACAGHAKMVTAGN